jgi:hypothetical protein
VREIGLPTLGFPETVERLEATSYESLTLADVRGHNGYPWCVAFLAPDRTEIVAVVAVLGPVPPT